MSSQQFGVTSNLFILLSGHIWLLSHVVCLVRDYMVLGRSSEASGLPAIRIPIVFCLKLRSR